MDSHGNARNLLLEQSNVKKKSVFKLDMEATTDVDLTFHAKDHVKSQDKSQLLASAANADDTFGCIYVDCVGSFIRNGQGKIHVELHAVKLELQLALRKGRYVNIEIQIERRDVCVVA